ncbi:MAG: InlB B-repeat-containing protein [Lachnospiraceae bacterium]|nr:InlB B-repeat-containing protein [Lachnospiraceae bacterium]
MKSIRTFFAVGIFTLAFIMPVYASEYEKEITDESLTQTDLTEAADASVYLSETGDKTDEESLEEEYPEEDVSFEYDEMLGDPSSEYTDIVLNTQMSGVSTASDPDGVTWFKLELDRSYMLKLTHTHDMYIFKDRGSDCIFSAYGNFDKTDETEYACLLKGTYYVKLWNCFKDENYSFTFSTVKADEYYQDSMEAHDDPAGRNDTKDSASDFTIDEDSDDSTIHGLLGYNNNVDWYHLNLAAPVKLTFKYNNYGKYGKDPYYMPTFTLYEGSRKVYETGQMLEAFPERTIGYKGSDYYLCVTRFNYENNNYNFHEYEVEFTPADKTITYDPNGREVTVPTDDSYHSTGDRIKVKTTDELENDDDFLGWSIYPGGSDTLYHRGDNFSIEDSSVTFYACWKKSFRITYDSNGGEGDVPTDYNRHYSGDLVPIYSRPSSLKRDGYRFLGWCTAKDSSGQIYQNGFHRIYSDKDITLYALWGKTYRISYDPNGLPIEVPESYEEYTYGQEAEIKMPENLGIFEGGFLGWSDDKNAETPKYGYKSNDKVEMKGDLVLYAVWGRPDEPVIPDKEYVVPEGYPCSYFELHLEEDSTIDVRMAASVDYPYDHINDRTMSFDIYDEDGIWMLPTHVRKIENDTLVFDNAVLPGGRTYYIGVKQDDGIYHPVPEGCELLVITDPSAVDSYSYKFKNICDDADDELFYYMMGGRTKENKEIYKKFSKDKGKGGTCFGMAATSGMFSVTGNGVNVGDFDEGKTAIKELSKTDTHNTWMYQKNGPDTLPCPFTVDEFIKALYTTQVSKLKENIETECTNDPMSLYDIVASETAEGRPVAVTMSGEYNSKGAAHTVLAYGVKDISEDHKRILVYDSNTPGEENAVIVEKSGSNWVWSYRHKVKKDFTNLTWGTGLNLTRLAYMTYDSYYRLWQKRGHLNDDNSAMLIKTTAKTIKVYDSNNELVAIVLNGMLTYSTPGVYMPQISSLSPNTSSTDNDGIMLYLPVGNYIIENTDETETGNWDLDFANGNIGGNVKASAGRISVLSDDENDIVKVAFPDGTDAPFEVTLESTGEDRRDILINGTAAEAEGFLQMTNGEYSKSDNITADDPIALEEETFSVRFDTQGGTDVENIYNVEKGSCVDLPATAKEGYAFGGWFTEKNGKGKEFTDRTPVNSDLTVYAYWFEGRGQSQYSVRLLDWEEIQKRCYYLRVYENDPEKDGSFIDVTAGATPYHNIFISDQDGWHIAEGAREIRIMFHVFPGYSLSSIKGMIGDRDAYMYLVDTEERNENGKDYYYSIKADSDGNGIIEGDLDFALTLKKNPKPAFSVKNKTMNAGEKLRLVEIFDEYSDDLVFNSSNEEAAALGVQYGWPAIEAKAAGKSRITAFDRNGQTLSTLDLTVYDPVISGTKDIYLDGKTTKLKVTGGCGTTTWSSSDESILTVTKAGAVKGISAGRAMVIAVNNGKTLEFEVIVHNVPRLITSGIKINVGETLRIDENIFDPADTDPKAITYTLAKTAAATINGNVLTPVNKGNCSVTIKAGDRTFTLKITIYDPELTGPDVIYLNSTATLRITSGDSVTTWSVDKPGILSVTDKGVIKGISKGLARVTAVNNGKTLTKNIRVCTVPGFLTNTKDINLDDTLSLDSPFFDDGGSGTVSFKTSNVKIAYIDGNVLRPLKTGNITLTATIDRKNYTTRIRIYDPALKAPDVIYLNNKKVNLSVKNGAKTTEWSVDAPEVLELKANGEAKGISQGYARVTAINNGRVLHKNIYVCPIPGFTDKTKEINLDEVLDLNGFFDASGIRGITYKTNDPGTAYVEDDTLIPLKAGNVKLTAIADGKSYTAKVIIYDPGLDVPDAVYINKKKVTIKVNNGTKVTEWINNDPDVLSLTPQNNSGKAVIKGLKKGSAVIEARNNGRTLKKKINVYNLPYFNKIYYTNLTNPVSVVLLNKDFDLPAPVYSVSNNKYATIDANGLLTPLKAGTVTVYAEVAGVTYSTRVTIVPIRVD